MLAAIVLSAVALQSPPRIEIVWTTELSGEYVNLMPITGNNDWLLIYAEGFSQLSVATGEISKIAPQRESRANRAIPPDLIYQYDVDSVSRLYMPDLYTYDRWISIFDHPYAYEPVQGWSSVRRAPLFFLTRPPGLSEDAEAVTFVHEGEALFAVTEDKVLRFSRADWSIEKEAPKPVDAFTSSRLISNQFLVFNVEADDGDLSSFAISKELESVETGELFESFFLDDTQLLASTGSDARSGLSMIDLATAKQIWHRPSIGLGTLEEIEVQATDWGNKVVVTESRDPFGVSAVVVLDKQTGETIATKRVLGKAIGIYPFGDMLIIKFLIDGKLTLRGLRVG